VSEARTFVLKIYIYICVHYDENSCFKTIVDQRSCNQTAIENMSCESARAYAHARAQSRGHTCAHVHALSEISLLVKMEIMRNDSIFNTVSLIAKPMNRCKLKVRLKKIEKVCALIQTSTLTRMRTSEHTRDKYTCRKNNGL
jgi:hypothetical protein